MSEIEITEIGRDYLWFECDEGRKTGCVYVYLKPVKKDGFTDYVPAGWRMVTSVHGPDCIYPTQEEAIAATLLKLQQ